MIKNLFAIALVMGALRSMFEYMGRIPFKPGSTCT